MDIRILFVLTLSWMLVACEKPGILDVSKCEKYTAVVSACTGEKNDPKVTINTESLNVAPPNVCAMPGTTLVITVVPPAKNKIGSVAIIPKNPKDAWLTGTNSPDKTKIEILIPNWVSGGEPGVGTNHDYGFVTIDGKCIDPRVNVQE
jgi:hypothetical protein